MPFKGSISLTNFSNEVYYLVWLMLSALVLNKTHISITYKGVFLNVPKILWLQCNRLQWARKRI